VQPRVDADLKISICRRDLKEFGEIRMIVASRRNRNGYGSGLIRLTTPRGWLFGATIVAAVGVLLLQMESLVWTAACFERAKSFNVLCASPPPAWQIAATVALVVAFAVLFGSEWRVAVGQRSRGAPTADT
jgi:hypothetical protein